MQDSPAADEGGAIAADETDRLIASNKVEGTAVYNRTGDHLGEVTTSWWTSTPDRWRTR
jgi:hypothetical protein